MIDRPSHRRFIAVLLMGALTLVGIAATGIGGLPVLAVASIVVLGAVDVCFRGVVHGHGDATVATERRADYEPA